MGEIPKLHLPDDHPSVLLLGLFAGTSAVTAGVGLHALHHHQIPQGDPNIDDLMRARASVLQDKRIIKYQKGTTLRVAALIAIAERPLMSVEIQDQLGLDPDRTITSTSFLIERAIIMRQMPKRRAPHVFHPAPPLEWAAGRPAEYPFLHEAMQKLRAT